MNRALATTIAVLPFAAAYALYATGTLERLDFLVDRHRWGPKPPHEGPTRPLENYVGAWQSGHVPNYGTQWVARVVVRTEGKRAWMRLWHRCGQSYCEQGEFEASVRGKPPDNVYALDVVRKKSKDVFWTITLRPNGTDPNSVLILDDRRARDPVKNPNDNQSSMTGLRRAK